ncbi:hypothetical protein BY458DRAFT_559208 [Sporodiniella umbellata]|nr:hypothetical protein BY458DRAFT_559208 [Sporodiniella umbellata]
MYIDKENDHNDVARKGVEFSELKIKALLCQAIDETAKEFSKTESSHKLMWVKQKKIYATWNSATTRYKYYHQEGGHKSFEHLRGSNPNTTSKKKDINSYQDKNAKLDVKNEQRIKAQKEEEKTVETDDANMGSDSESEVDEEKQHFCDNIRSYKVHKNGEIVIRSPDGDGQSSEHQMENNMAEDSDMVPNERR